MPAQTRTKPQRLADRQETARLYLQCVPQYLIAERMGVSVKQIEYDLVRIREDWKQRAAESIQARKAEELARLDRLEAVYWEEYEAAAGKRTITTITKQGGKRRVQLRRETGQSRDLAALAGVERCIQQRRAILGLDAPVKTALTDTAGNDLVPLEALRALHLRALGQQSAALAPGTVVSVEEDDTE